MSETQFLKTMIEVVKWGEFECKDELLGVLRNSIITFDKTTAFTRKTDQRWENIDLRVPVPMLGVAKNLKSTLQSIAEDIYVETDYNDFHNLNIKPKLIELDIDTYKEYDVVFNEIQETIIQSIRTAKYTIWVAVAWFTDREIFNELIVKKEQGVDIRIITSDEESNKSLLAELEENFNTVKVPKQRYNRLHDKFCIIDFEFVIHGSYNWSNTARGNDETLSTALDRDLVNKFAEEFMRLYNEYK